MPGTHGHLAVRVLYRATPTVTRGILYVGHLQGPVTLAPIAERLAVELSQLVFTTKVCRGWDSNTQERDKRSYPLRHRQGLYMMDVKHVCIS